MRDMRQHVDNPRIVWAALGGLFGHQTPSSGTVFKRSRHPNQIRRHVFQDSQRLPLVIIYFFLLFSFLHLDFHAKKESKKQHFNLLVL